MHTNFFYPENLVAYILSFTCQILKKFRSDEILVIPLKEIKLDKSLQFVEERVEIMDQEVKRTKKSRILIVKVRWNANRGPDFT